RESPCVPGRRTTLNVQRSKASGLGSTLNSPWAGGRAQCEATTPEFARAENSCRRDNARDQFRRGHVEAGIKCWAVGVGHSDVFSAAGGGLAPGSQHFSLVSFL